MHHTRKQIIENQTKYREEIVDFLKKEFSNMKKDLKKIKTQDVEINNSKKRMMERVAKMNVTKEINNYFISWKNIYPKFYAWWDEISGEVIKLKYDEN